MIQKEVESGFQSYTKGMNKTENPHAVGSIEHDSWDHGWEYGNHCLMVYPSYNLMPI